MGIQMIMICTYTPEKRIQAHRVLHKQARSQPVYTGKAAILGMLVRIAKLYGKTLAGKLVPVVMLRDCLVVAP